MLMMRRLKAVVGRGGAVMVQDHVEYPEGTELQLDVLEPVEGLDAPTLAAIDVELSARKLAYEKSGKAYTAAETVEWLRARR